MKPTHKDIRAIKILFKEKAKLISNRAPEEVIIMCSQKINYNLGIYKYHSEIEFAREHSFCVSCGNQLDQDNKCQKCGMEFGW